MGCELRPGIRWATEPVLAARRGEVPDNVYNHKVIPRWEHCFGGKRVRRRTDMAAYIIVDIDIHDVDGMKEYRERVATLSCAELKSHHAAAQGTRRTLISVRVN